MTGEKGMESLVQKEAGVMTGDKGMESLGQKDARGMTGEKFVQGSSLPIGTVRSEIRKEQVGAPPPLSARVKVEQDFNGVKKTSKPVDDERRSRSPDDEEMRQKRRRRSTEIDCQDQFHFQARSRERHYDQHTRRREQYYRDSSDGVQGMNSSDDGHDVDVEWRTPRSPVDRRGGQGSRRDFQRVHGSRERENSDERYGSHSRVGDEFHSRDRHRRYDAMYHRGEAPDRNSRVHARSRPPSDGMYEREWKTPRFRVNERESDRDFPRVDSRDREKRNRRRFDMPLLSKRLPVNDKGEPQGDFQTVVSNKLAALVKRYVPLFQTWKSVTPEVKHKICVELQSKITEGVWLDGGWIKKKARELHDKARTKAKNVDFRNKCESANRSRTGSPSYTWQG